MNLFRPSKWGIFKIWNDIENYRDFINVMKRERDDPNSKFNEWKINTNVFGSLYFTMDIKEEEASLPVNIQRLRLIESLSNLHRYLDEELGFAECLTPEFNQFYDDEGKPTLTYLIAYRFSFNKLSLFWVLKWSCIIGLLIFGYKYLPIQEIIEYIQQIPWIKNLT